MSKYPIVFFLICISAFLLYPAWYHETLSSVEKIILLNFSFVYYTGLTYIIWKIFGNIDLQINHKDNTTLSRIKIYPKTRIIKMLPYILGSLLLIGLEYRFLSEPIISELDSHLHAGLPALLLENINWIFFTEFNMVLTRLILGVIIIIIGAEIYVFIKKTTIKSYLPIVIFLITALVIINVYGIFLVKSNILEQLGNISLIHRYPPLGKTIFFIGYILGGINESVGRIIQLAFLLVGAYIASMIPALFGGKRSLPAFLLYIFMPPFNNIIYLNHLSNGNVFFATLAIYLLLKYLKENSTRNLLFINFALCVALLYHQLALPYVVCAFLILLCYTKGYFMKRVKFSIQSIVIPALFFLPSLILDKIFRYSPSGINFAKLLELSNSVLNFKMIPLALTTPVFWIFLISLIYLLLFRRNIYLGVLLIWFGVCYLLISTSAALGYIRHALFYYPVIVLVISSFLDHAFRKRLNVIKIALLYSILACFIYYSFFSYQSIFFTYKNSKRFFLPYDKAFRYIRNNLSSASIYAPAICEPSHFYIAKYGLSKTLSYGREIWTPPEKQTISNLTQYMHYKKFQYLLLPTSEKRCNSKESCFSEKYYYVLKEDYTAEPWLSNEIRWELVQDINAGEENLEIIATFTNQEARLKLFRLSK